MLAESELPSIYQNEKDLQPQSSKSSIASKSISVSDKASQYTRTSSSVDDEETTENIKENGSGVQVATASKSQESTSHETFNEEGQIQEQEQHTNEDLIKNTDNNEPAISTTQPEEPRQKSAEVQTKIENEENVSADHQKLHLPLSAITLQSILIAARAKSAAKMSPKQYAVYQLSNEIILLIQQSLKSERIAYGFVGHPITSAVGHQMDRLAWWFSIIHCCVQNLNPPRGYILPALRMLRQDISAVADIAVEMITIHKNIQKQLQKMASGLNTVFARHEDLFGVQNWENKLDEIRTEDVDEVREKLDKFLHSSSEATVRLTAFEMKTLLVQHETNSDYKSMTLNKLNLKCQREFIKSCIDHVNSALKSSLQNSVLAQQALRKAEKDIQEGVDKLVRKLEYMRRVHRFRESSCAFLLKKSLNTLGICFYEYIDMVRFIRKLARFVLLASEYILRHANGWSHLCDVTCLQQLDCILEEFMGKERSVLLRCFKKLPDKATTRENIMETFEDYFQQWIKSNISTVQVTLPISNATAKILFCGSEAESVKLDDAEAEGISIEDLNRPVVQRVSSSELEVTFITKNIKCAESVSEPDTLQRLEEIGIKLEQPISTGPRSSYRTRPSEEKLKEMQMP